MKNARLGIRLDAETKDLIQLAAELRNQTVTQFVVAAVFDAADKVVAEHSRTELSNRDRDLFLKLLDTPPAPNKALRRAASAYREHVAS